jgi:hypothetical protein
MSLGVRGLHRRELSRVFSHLEVRPLNAAVLALPFALQKVPLTIVRGLAGAALYEKKRR